MLGLVALLNPSHKAEATRSVSDEVMADELGELLNLPLTLPAQAALTPVPPATSHDHDIGWQTVSVAQGDNLSLIFERLHLSPQQLHAVLEADKEERHLRLLRPKQTLLFQIVDNELKAIQYPLNASKNYLISRTNDGFAGKVLEKPVEIRLTHASGEISSSLFQAGQKAGLSDNLIMELANIFGWDVDFALDIRSGDTFSLLFEEQYLDGEKLRDGNILAAEFTNRGESYRAVLFTDAEGRSQYYSADGKSMRKAFLRSPVDFRRISSTFQRERFHPVLGKKRPHRGVDYAAATGTPIKAAGDGKIIFRGTKGGYGKTVILQHGGKYTTLYAHLSKFRSDLGNGSRVKQGQVIGYVGKTGVATGPHLHYEFRVDGEHRNPLTVKFPDAAPIPKAQQKAFRQQTQQLLAQLDLFRRVQVAANAP
ncbi:MAG: peptidoglycan DD-metalloendopeptidase family protein [Gammaproteobacteria bacterium]|nr:peptidoglycan DD-metalloendopeptidase family protein [Gammaproteobacteria bacterium]